MPGNRPPTEAVVSLKSLTGPFAEDKDTAAAIREENIRPTLATGQQVTLDFTGVRVATQSFVHALVSEVLRQSGESVLARITFKGCSKAVRGIIETVVQYSLESLEAEDTDTDRKGRGRTGAATSAKRRKRRET